MVLEAAAKFGCPHRYIARVEPERTLFECEVCHHRRELLPLDRHPHEAVRVLGRSRSTWRSVIGDTA